MGGTGATTDRATTVELSTGAYLDLVAPDPAAITLEAVAHGLSQCCRFGNQSRCFYSVAEHAVRVADRLKAQGCPPPVQLMGLHHDDPEAFTGDATRPLKEAMRALGSDAWDVLEGRLLAACWVALDLPVPSGTWERPAVKRADDWVAAAEAWHLMPSRGQGWGWTDVYYAERDGAQWPLGASSWAAKQGWLERHYELVYRADLEWRGAS